MLHHRREPFLLESKKWTTHDSHFRMREGSASTRRSAVASAIGAQRSAGLCNSASFSRRSLPSRLRSCAMRGCWSNREFTSETNASPGNMPLSTRRTAPLSLSRNAMSCPRKASPSAESRHPRTAALSLTEATILEASNHRSSARTSVSNSVGQHGLIGHEQESVDPIVPSPGCCGHRPSLSHLGKIIITPLLHRLPVSSNLTVCKQGSHPKGT